MREKDKKKDRSGSERERERERESERGYRCGRVRERDRYGIETESV